LSSHHSEIPPQGESVTRGGNIILVGVTGCGKSTVGGLLARLVGFGYVDVDQLIMKAARKSIEKIFETDGEQAFRDLESKTIQSLGAIRNHVIAVGGGAVAQDSNWTELQRLGVTVWVQTAPEEIARRICMKPDEIRRRPLLQDLVNVGDRVARQKQLTERLRALLGQRRDRYSEARLSIQDSYSTPETCAYLLKSTLLAEGLLATATLQR
jgi:shikimate kinase